MSKRESLDGQMLVEVNPSPSEDTANNTRILLLSTRSEEELPVGHYQYLWFLCSYMCHLWFKGDILEHWNRMVLSINFKYDFYQNRS